MRGRTASGIRNAPISARASQRPACANPVRRSFEGRAGTARETGPWPCTFPRRRGGSPVTRLAPAGPPEGRIRWSPVGAPLNVTRPEADVGARPQDAPLAPVETWDATWAGSGGARLRGTGLRLPPPLRTPSAATARASDSWRSEAHADSRSRTCTRSSATKCTAWTRHREDWRSPGPTVTRNGVPARLFLGDVFTTALPGPYDLVYSGGVVEHFAGLDGILRRHVELLRPGGWLIVGVPNVGGVHRPLMRWLQPENYAIHNVRSCSPWSLRSALERIEPGLDVPALRLRQDLPPLLRDACVGPLAGAGPREGAARRSRLDDVPNRLLSPDAYVIARRPLRPPRRST